MPARLVLEPTVTVIGSSCFQMPWHLPMEALGPATGAERLCEYAGRVCYMSQANPGRKTTATYLTHIRTQQHFSVLEHASVTLLLEGVSRSLTHELIRHRHLSFSEVSQRYVDMTQVPIVVPPLLLAHPAGLPDWITLQEAKLAEYQLLVQHLEAAGTPRKQVREAARSVLPSCVETKIVVTGNLRAWRHVLHLRGSPHADAEIRRCTVAIAQRLVQEAPAVFSDCTITADSVTVGTPEGP